MGNACLSEGSEHKTANSPSKRNSIGHTEVTSGSEFPPKARDNSRDLARIQTDDRMQTRSRTKQKTYDVDVGGDRQNAHRPLPVLHEDIPREATQRDPDEGYSQVSGLSPGVDAYQHAYQTQHRVDRDTHDTEGRFHQREEQLDITKEERHVEEPSGSPKRKRKKKHKRKSKAPPMEEEADDTYVNRQPAAIATIRDVQQFYSPEEVRLSQLTERVLVLEQTLAEKEDAIWSLSENLKNEKEQCEALRIRLSGIAAMKLTDNNPNIADLSDLNRPTKLAERYTEVYDNIWTEAFTEMTEELGMTEEQAERMLLNILIRVYKTCSSIADDQLDKLMFDVRAFTSSEGEPDTGIMKMCKDVRKKNFKNMLPTIKKELVMHDIKPEMQHTIKFRDELTEMCWLMTIHDPPVVVDTRVDKHRDHFDRTTFKAYTQSGKVIDYVVWPAVHLYSGGPVLCKGIVQCMAKDTHEEHMTDDVIQPDVLPVNDNNNTGFEHEKWAQRIPQASNEGQQAEILQPISTDVHTEIQQRSDEHTISGVNETEIMN